MRKFAALFESLDTTTSTRLKTEAMVEYFRAANPADGAWAVHVLMGRRVKRSVGPALLRAWLGEEAQLPDWLIEETYGAIGDLAETIALLVAPQGSSSAAPGACLTLTDWFESRILPLAALSAEEQRALVVGVGAVATTELASAAGLACDNGIVVDEHCRTSDAAIFAAGDVRYVGDPAAAGRNPARR